MFKAVNLTEEARQYSELADGIRGAFNKAFVGADGRIKGDVQACYAMALEMDLLDPAMQSKAMERLFEAIGRYGDHLSTGIHTTKRLLITLSRRGHHELACKLAMQPTVPSFGAMIDQDATAIWERLDAIHPRLGVNPEEMSDLNHNGFASVGQWIFGQIGGVQPDPQAPGYKQVIIAPRPGGGITWAKADYDSIRGLIACHWKLEGDQLTVDVTIPPNVAATVVIPTADIASVRESNQPIANAADVKAIAQNNDAVVVRTGSGKFSFTAVWRALHTSVKVD
jgi:alpha-L-rhamnosidase